MKFIFARFDSDPHAIVRWTTAASPGDFASLAPAVVEHSRELDAVAADLMRSAAAHLDSLAARLIMLGANRIALVGGLSASIEPWLADSTRRHLVPPLGDALDGALRLARESMQLAAETEHP